MSRRTRKADEESAIPEDKLKAARAYEDLSPVTHAVWYTIAKIVEEEELAMQRPGKDGNPESTASASEAFVAALVELVWSQLQTVAVDLEAFARFKVRCIVFDHAQPAAEDVLLIARRNPALSALLRTHLDETGHAPKADVKMDEDKPVSKAKRAKPKPKNA